MQLRFKSAALLGMISFSLISARANQGIVGDRLTPSNITDLVRHGAGAGTSGVTGIQTTILSGDPTQKGLYTIKLNVPANTRIEAHSHRDNRSATVVSGIWYLGYGHHFDTKGLKALPPGSFYTEPSGLPHYAQTISVPIVVYITGYGPTSTTYVKNTSAAR